MFTFLSALLVAAQGGGAQPRVDLTKLTGAASTVGTGGTNVATTVLADGTLQHTILSVNTTDGTWLKSGLNSAYECRITGQGTYTTPSGSALNTWLALSSNRGVSYSVGKGGLASGTFLYEIRDASTLTVLTSKSISLYAESLDIGGGGNCPLCCFTPETLIAMADGSSKAIEKILAGDMVATVSGPVGVSEVLVREQRPMFALTFDDGTKINASEDHPFYVVGNGYASLNPTVPYKGLGIPGRLEVGDRVERIDGTTTELVEVTSIEYPGKVYTLAESGFYANGLLVY